MASMSSALCTPNTNWASATHADIQSIDTPFSARTVPVEHRNPGSYTIQRSQYPYGLLLIPTNHDPASSPATLPAAVAAASSYNATLDPSDPDDWGAGGVVVFV